MLPKVESLAFFHRLSLQHPLKFDKKRKGKPTLECASLKQIVKLKFRCAAETARSHHYYTLSNRRNRSGQIAYSVALWCEY